MFLSHLKIYLATMCVSIAPRSFVHQFLCHSHEPSPLRSSRLTSKHNCNFLPLLCTLTRLWVSVVMVLLVRLFPFLQFDFTTSQLAHSVLHWHYPRWYEWIYHAVFVVAHFLPWIPFGLCVISISHEPSPSRAQASSFVSALLSH
jgi:hypothetical protein